MFSVLSTNLLVEKKTVSQAVALDAIFAVLEMDDRELPHHKFLRGLVWSPCYDYQALTPNILR